MVLNGMVIQALSNAMQLSYKNAMYEWNGAWSSLSELYRNSLVVGTQLVTAATLDQLTFRFKAETDSEKPFEMVFNARDFKEVTDRNSA